MKKMESDVFNQITVLTIKPFNAGILQKNKNWVKHKEISMIEMNQHEP